MTLKLYDEALERKLKSVFPNFVMAPPDSAFDRKTVDGKTVLPLVSAYRISNPINFDAYNNYEVFSGRVSRRTNSSTELIRQHGLPVTLTYQVDIWTEFREESDDLFRELVYYMMTNPNLVVDVPNIDEPFHFSMQLTDTDNPTEYGSFTDEGTLHRYALTYEVPNARMFFQTGNIPLIKTSSISIDTGDGLEEVAIDYGK